MSGVEVAPGSSLASALTNLVQTKVAEIGWSSGAGDDSALAQYIVLMLGNNKTKEAITTELANDLLGLSPADATAIQFVDWLFQEVQNLHDAGAHSGVDAGTVSEGQQTHQAPESVEVPMEDASMGTENDGVDNQPIPTGPKSMRTANVNVRGRDKRMLGQMRNAMDRSNDQSLHRIRGASGAGRVAREPPKGPKSMTRPSHMQGRPGHAPNQSGMSSSALNAFANVTPNQQMQLMKMMEEQSRMMAQLLGPNAPQPAFNPKFFGNKANSGKSLSERMSRSQGQNGHSRNGSLHKSNGDVDMEKATNSIAADNDAAATTKCKFQLRCTSASCPYAHQSSAGPPNMDFDVSDRCTFGVACTNRKCNGRHPSPAQKTQHAATVDCKFFPNCTNTSCPFRHPEVAPCKNGADCPDREKGCTYSHSSIECRYTPCLNERCAYRHVEGQKRNNKWSANGSHVPTSERRFVADETKEELILPGRMDEEGGAQDPMVTDVAVQQDMVT